MTIISCLAIAAIARIVVIAHIGQALLIIHPHIRLTIPLPAQLGLLEFQVHRQLRAPQKRVLHQE